MASIIVENLSKNFPGGTGSNGLLFPKSRPEKEVLSGISFTVEPGDRVGIIGSNGAGKSTLLRLIGGIYRPSSGKISVDGNMFLSLGFNWIRPRLKVIDNIHLGAALHGIAPRAINKNLADIIEFSGVPDSLGRRIDQLSSGQQERLVVSSVLYFTIACRADILLADEIFGHSDVDFVNQALERWSGSDPKKFTLLMVSHKLDVIAKNCSRAIWLDRRRIAGIGEPVSIIREYNESAASH